MIRQDARRQATHRNDKIKESGVFSRVDSDPVSLLEPSDTAREADYRDTTGAANQLMRDAIAVSSTDSSDFVNGRTNEQCLVTLPCSRTISFL